MQCVLPSCHRLWCCMSTHIRLCTCQRWWHQRYQRSSLNQRVSDEERLSLYSAAGWSSARNPSRFCLIIVDLNKIFNLIQGKEGRSIQPFRDKVSYLVAIPWKHCVLSTMCIWKVKLATTDARESHSIGCLLSKCLQWFICSCRNTLQCCSFIMSLWATEPGQLSSLHTVEERAQSSACQARSTWPSLPPWCQPSSPVNKRECSISKQVYIPSCTPLWSPWSRTLTC